ncbi:hypothetical protein Taro_041864 [Colocasia esculenta]|uniref:Uncharacterized protein n=1 Tax=Colocasia esculenta TaxID=4460 RepID=A0A843X1E2_COLES|nr:hypothetical protein [Colocasia esculenta]
MIEMIELGGVASGSFHKPAGRSVQSSSRPSSSAPLGELTSEISIFPHPSRPSQHPTDLHFSTSPESLFGLLYLVILSNLVKTFLFDSISLRLFFGAFQKSVYPEEICVN